MSTLIKKLRAIQQALILSLVVFVLIPTLILGFALSHSYNSVWLASAVALIVLLDIGANVLNNYSDWETDLFNNKRNKMHKNISKKTLLYLYLSSQILILIPFYFLPNKGYLALFTFCFIALGILYSFGIKLKEITPLNYVAIGIAYAFLPISMGLFAGGSTYNTYINWLPLILFMSMVTFSYTIAKEYSDVFGDSKSGRKTLPLLLGKEKSIRAQFVFIALSYLFLIVLIASGYLKYTFLLALLSLVFEIYILINMRNTENQPKLVKFALYNKISHLFLRVLIVISFLV